MSSNVDLMVGNRPISTLRVVDLKQELEKRGLSKSGSKKDLVERLRLHLQIEKHRDTGASADEEELPNYSVHDELADQNPFIRDYLASQAELFHSQKVVKKLVEEEAKRESETSADEGVDSPMKQPPTLEREESPVTETRRQSRRRIDSQKEEMTAEKLVTRSSRSRSNEPRDDSRSQSVNERRNEPDADKNGENQSRGEESPAPVIEAPSKVIETPSKVIETPSKVIETPSEVVKTPNEEVKTPNEEVKTPNEEVKTPNEEVKKPNEEVEVETPNEVNVTPSKVIKTSNELNETPCEAIKTPNEVNETSSEVIKTPNEVIETRRNKTRSVSRSPVPEKSAETKKSEATSEEPKPKDDPETRPETVPVRAEPEEKKKDVEESPSPKSSESTEENEKRNEPDANDEADSREEESPTIETTKTRRSRSRSPVREKSPPKETEVPSKALEPEKKSETASVVVEKKKDVDESPSPARSDDSRDDSHSGGEDEKRSEADENTEELRGKESPTTETSSKTPRSRSSSSSRSPVREKTPEKEMETSRSEEPDREEKSESKSAQAEEKMDVDESSSPRYKSSQKETSYTNNDIAGEEALDYGEEEDDEDRNESDPQEFSWARRSLRFKTKNAFTAPICKWKLEEESKHLVVKSELLNSYYEDIKLVPLEQLKLEEKSAEASAETKKEVERKPSISREAESVEPLLTRTVENVAPTIKRTVSIIPSTKTTTDDAEETDKALTPPRNPPSDVLLITNLVRPFTLIQLKEMLQRTGNLQDIWVDKIKSKCIAKFGSQEEAFETRAALHGVCWPNSNPKSLHVDYTTQDNLDEHKAKEGAEQSLGTEKPVSAQPVPVREWDVGKKAEPKSPGRNRKRSRSRSTSRDRTKRSRRTPSPGRRRRSKSPAPERRSRGGEGKEPEPMGKALDELFRKTIATPSIYWLPLTPEQIAEKEELRRKRMLERERRLAEMSKMRPR